MNTFEKIKSGIPKTVSIPAGLEKLCHWTDTHGYPISGCFELSADDGETITSWMGFDKVSDRFGVFGNGPDGSLYAFWINDNADQKIVHLGSEGEELYILAEDFTDFLRLLAIGYDEIGFSDMDMTLEEWNDILDVEKDYGANPEFREWVISEFEVSIPERGHEIADMNDRSFAEWIENQLEKYTSAAD
ncbi:hypothetical protein SAMN02927921_01314 [Sinomicrobium oceani]|uniref:SMI1 / KNR4 family (SUKH-1) n=1 Tax=Sinomicrobium oceani TaxID=1150368 RepID=A0A1K1NLT3_9FLAO|nr:SMI1/KNR4 family protein [Sinomicrobium oceani]SFW36243.1 hypothetical protein SAMN02927921_01314 [Sinomicrobium oceani]